VLGGISWIAIFLFGGFFFGNIPLVRDNFGLVVIAIIVLSVLPPIVEYVQHRRRRMPATIDGKPVPGGGGAPPAGGPP